MKVLRIFGDESYIQELDAQLGMDAMHDALPEGLSWEVVDE